MSAAEFTAELTRSHPQYVVKDLLGYGGMGAVYLAEDREASRQVAIKMLRPDAHDDETYLRRFDREIKILQGLDHPNIVRTLDAGETHDGYQFFVMELLTGRALANELEEPGRMSFERVLRVMSDLCAGAQHAHDKNIIHRDLKAANIFLSSDGRAVILDFGVARDVTTKPSSVSGRQGVPGTRGHIAPELYEGKPATRASDVFSLGIVFLHMLVGKIPDGAYVMPSHYGYDPRLDAVVTRALSRNPQDRYQSAKDFAEAIKVATSPAPPKPVEPVPPPPRRDPPRASNNPEELARSERMEVQFADARSVEQHKAFFRAYAYEKPILTGAAPRVGEEWCVVDEWDASHKVPKKGGGVVGEPVNPPALVAWSPDGKRLFTAADAWGLSVWDATEYRRGEYRRLGQQVDPTAYGFPQHFFIAQRGYDYRVLQETESFQNRYYLLHDDEAQQIVQGIKNHFGYRNMWGRLSEGSTPPPLSINGNMGFNPWRPSLFEIALVENYSSLKIVDTTRLEKLELAERGLSQRQESKSLFREILSNLFSRHQPEAEPRPSPLHDAPAMYCLEFDLLGEGDKTIFEFLWHPSGEYLAVDTGDWNDESNRRIHIVHVRSAQIVASIPATARSLRWSPGGRYLLVKRWVPSSDGKLTAEAGVWDSASFETQFGELETILSQPWAINGQHSGPQSPDASFFSYDKPATALSVDGQRMLTAGGTVITTVKREGCSVSAGEVLAKIARQGFAHAAWSPTDPHCFVTVGGAGSEKFPDMYKYWDCPHGQLLRMWRLK
jgi:predicted Ser/Thr protein kinase